jgi:hypothetical protein
MRLDGFDENVTINHVGLLLRKVAKDNAQNHFWLLDVKGYPVQKKKTTSFSNLPFLVRGRVLNATQAPTLKPNFRFSIDSTEQFEEVLLSKYGGRLYPQSLYIDRQESELWGYRTFFKGTELIFPQLEMARALFLNTTYLTRKSMGTALIDLEFDRQFDEVTRHLQIHFTKVNKFSPSAMENSKVRQMLSWLLFQPDAIKSYQSIYRHYVQERVFEGGWEKWMFRFDLPDLSGWEMTLRGRYLEGHERQFFVEEITGLINATQMPRKVTFTGEMFDKREWVEGPSVNVIEGEKGTGTDDGPKTALPSEHAEVDDHEEPSDLANSVIFILQSEGMVFSNAFEAKIESDVKGKRSDGTAGKIDLEKRKKAADGGAETSCSTHEASSYGAGRQAETVPEEQKEGFESLEGETDQGVSAGGGNAFAAFDKMVSLLQKKHYWKLEEENIFALDKVGRSRLYCLKTTGKPRQVKTVRLSKKTENVLFNVRLIEVDTTDGVKAVSTKILQQDDQEKWQNKLSDLKEQLVTKSIAWPNEILNGITKYKVKYLIHPHCAGTNINNILQDDIKRWAMRADEEMSTVEPKQG